MTWQRVQYNTNQPDTDYYKRSGHASTLLGDENVILYYGGQNGPLSLATDPIFLDVSKMEWIRTSNTNGDRIIIHKNSVEQDTAQEKHKLGGGAIVGIIISVVGIVAICIGLFIWRKRHHRQQSIHQKSRAARFSHVLFQGENRIAGTGLLADRNFLSLPELALSRESSNSRISAISLGAEFRFSADEYHHSHQSAGNQPLSILSEESNDFKKRESIGFKRLTLNLFSGSTSSMHLAVTNAQRASSYYSDSTQSTPRSPMFPSNLRDSAVHYQLNELEANSWNSEQGRSTTTPPEK
ncbi:uncharacterized protein EV154DRAFT_416640 [Mucor mucedo]|uniref:uncharacterized protein n=1 Tax=Mucor mucedo TaxID=29922 RepID=UPI00221F28E2|nr:uncharacterized protein EV154DRAFT_416640 [Mucor mucedo]KAI7893602.1 hypothetical protein EV154DRAFT_416640 [Mucor mucedo]